MKRSNNIFQKMFGRIGFGSKTVPLKSNIFNAGGRGYSTIGGTSSGILGSSRKSPLLGSATPSNLMSLYYQKCDELKGYQLLDISKLVTNFFADYIINFMKFESNEIVSILDENGDKDETKTERINEILLKQLKWPEYIRDHVKDYVYSGEYFSLLRKERDDMGHLVFRAEELFDPTTVITKKKRDPKTGETTDVFLARGEDNKIYEIPQEQICYIGNINFRLINDLEDNYNGKGNTPTLSRDGSNGSNYSKVVRAFSYSAGEPLFYSLILKVKELVIKELLVSLISLRDLSSLQIFLLQFDKNTPLEAASELCNKTTKLANNSNELASFLTSQFDIVSFIENTLTQSAKFVPDYNSTVSNKNSALPLDKLSDKILEVLQTLDTCRQNVLGPLGIPSTILDSTSGSKWTILQQSERANSRITSFMTGIKDSTSFLVRNLYRILYQEDLDPSLIKLHLTEKTTVEYNNQINQSESVSGLVQGVSNILTNCMQTIDITAPLIDTKAYLSYIQNLIKDIDPNTDAIITEETLERYLKYSEALLRTKAEQSGMDPSIFDNPNER